MVRGRNVPDSLQLAECVTRLILLRETKRKLRCDFIVIIIRFCLSTASFHSVDLISNATAIILSIKTLLLTNT